MKKSLARLFLLVFGLGVAVAALLLAEGVFRLVRDEPVYVVNVGLPEDVSGVTRPDPDLFWGLRPGFDGDVWEVGVRVNSLGLRGPEISDKRPGEMRVLCLGESSTFGAGVAQGNEYPRVLETLLRERTGNNGINVLNGGVFAYSSVQSWIFFKKFASQLRPDVVILYHEANDYLPSTLRSGHDGVVGALRTDWQLHRSRFLRLGQWLESRSHLFRYLQSRYAEARVERFESKPWRSPLTEVGLPAIGIPPRLYKGRVERGRELMRDEAGLGRRVTDEERELMLTRFVDTCERDGIRLVIVHPAYLETTPHTCLLTRFTDRRGLSILDAHPVLHPTDRPPGALFLDSWHPTAEGHRRLAEALAERLLDTEVPSTP